MKYAVNDKLILQEVPVGPLASYLAQFSESLSLKGYATHYIHRHVLIAACFSKWLKLKKIPRRSIRGNHTEQYLRYRYQFRRPSQGDRASLQHLIEFLRNNGLIPSTKIRKPKLTPTEKYVEEYGKYLREECLLSESTIINYTPFIARFLKDCFGNAPVRPSKLSGKDVIRFVQRQARKLQPKRAKLMTSALRSFFQYAIYRGELSQDLADSVPTVANWAMPAIPRAISEEKTRLLLDSIDRSTPVGLRDYAVIILLARLGLRSGEVAFLELDDIDWEEGILNVQGKNGHLNRLPLPKDVGESIVAYLQQGRPSCTSRRVFLRARAPIRGFLTQCAVGTIVRHALQRAGIDAPSTGAHQFRHGLLHRCYIKVLP